ncbi:hypothetical protein [Streptomyces pseudogriseolus]|uniref:hypothetical protein n=1 Tax=Streptomyces pseudogriseolus TaxID=36817 RepID=UPI00348FBCAF
MGFGKIAAHQVQKLAQMARDGAMDPASARKAAEDNLGRLKPADRAEAEAILRANAPR